MTFPESQPDITDASARALADKLLPVQIIDAATDKHGGCVRLPGGRDLLLSKDDAAALRAQPGTVSRESNRSEAHAPCDHDRRAPVSTGSVVNEPSVATVPDTSSAQSLPPEPVAWADPNIWKWLTPHGKLTDATMVWRQENGAATMPLYASPPAAETAGVKDSEIVRLINVLRADEGDSVTVLCDNPDFNGQPNCAIVCNGDWTGWVDKRFAADTVLDALSMAMTEKNLPSPRKVIATSNGHHWIERFNLVCCRDCGLVRRADDKNSPCKGAVGVGIRMDLATPADTSASVVGDFMRDALDLLQLQQRGRAQALRILDSTRKKSDPITLAMADAYEECGNELKAVLTAEGGKPGVGSVAQRTPMSDDAMRKALEASDDIIREVANTHDMETAEGRRISIALAKIISANAAALGVSSLDPGKRIAGPSTLSSTDQPCAKCGLALRVGGISDLTVLK